MLRDRVSTHAVSITLTATLSVFAIVFIAVGVLLSRADVFAHDVANVRSAIARDVPIGTRLSTVAAYARQNFEAVRWDAEDKCLAARYTTYAGGGRFSRFPTASVRVYFYFDAAGSLVRVEDHGSIGPESLVTPEEDKRATAESIEMLLRSLHLESTTFKFGSATRPSR